MSSLERRIDRYTQYLYPHKHTYIQVHTHIKISYIDADLVFFFVEWCIYGGKNVLIRVPSVWDDRKKKRKTQ